MTEAMTPDPILHADCGTALVWKRLPWPDGEPRNQHAMDPGLGLYCPHHARFVPRREWSDPDAKPVSCD